MAEQKATNVTWHDGEVTREHRTEILRQRGATIWFTGLSGSGKSTIAVALEKALHQIGKLSYRLDGDNVRHGINKNLGFSEEDRKENIRRIGEVAKLFVEAGVIVLAAFVSPYRKDREQVRSMLPHGDFYEVFCDCGLGICEERDPKGLYKKARAGEIRNFTGISDPYEPPVKPDMVFDTGRIQVEENLANLIDLLESKRLIAPPA